MHVDLILLGFTPSDTCPVSYEQPPVDNEFYTSIYDNEPGYASRLDDNLDQVTYDTLVNHTGINVTLVIPNNKARTMPLQILYVDVNDHSI